MSLFIKVMNASYYLGYQLWHGRRLLPKLMGQELCDWIHPKGLRAMFVHTLPAMN